MRESRKAIKQSKREHKLFVAQTKFLLSSGDISLTEARCIVQQSPGISNAKSVPIPVRLTMRGYPGNECTEEDFDRIQDFVLGAVYYRQEDYLLDVALTGGYVLVLTQNEGSARFVRSLMPQMRKEGLDVMEPTMGQIAEFYVRELGYDAPANVSENYSLSGF